MSAVAPCACGCGAPVAAPGLYADPKHMTWRHQAAVRSAQAKVARREERLKRTCAATGCTNRLDIRNDRYCSATCRNRTVNERKRVEAAEKATKRPRTAPLWEMRRELDEKGGTGRCVFCEGPLPKERPLICAKRRCEAEYQHVYRKGRRKGQAAADVPQAEVVDAAEAAAELGAFRLRIACELESFRAKVAALARDYGLTPPARAA